MVMGSAILTDTEILDWYITHWPKVAKFVGQEREPFFSMILHHNFPPIQSHDFRKCVEIAAATLEAENS